MPAPERWRFRVEGTLAAVDGQLLAAREGASLSHAVEQFEYLFGRAGPDARRKPEALSRRELVLGQRKPRAVELEPLRDPARQKLGDSCERRIVPH